MNEQMYQQNNFKLQFLVNKFVSYWKKEGYVFLQK